MAIGYYENITLSKIIEGTSILDSSTIISMMVLSFALAFGTQWGFNKIYSSERIEKFKKYKSELISNFRFRLRKLGLVKFKDDKEFNKEINKFIEEWQDFQENVNEYYDKLIWWRKEILIIFSLTGIIYFIRLLTPNLVLNGYKISIVSNLLFFLGLISIFIFIYKIIKLDSQIAKYDMEKSTPMESFKRIINMVKK